MKREERQERDESSREEEAAAGTGDKEVARRPYTPPRVVKKRSVARVTLFSGGGPTMTGLTANG
jgi:hypothetical protein